MASEKAIVLNIKRKANAIPGVRIKKLWSSHVNRDIDLLVVIYGVACFYEIKQPGKKPDDWQNNRLAWWAAAGAETGWFDDTQKCIDRIQQIADRARQQAGIMAWVLAK